MSKRLLRLDIDGLNLVLGGGVTVLKRHPTFQDESAVMVLRGPPGSGKTCLGVGLAGSIARTLGADVAYACIELLPSELAAQHQGVKRPEVNEIVVEAPFQEQGSRGDVCRFFAAVLDLGGEEGDTSRLTSAIDELLAAVNASGGAPRVLVLDSLSDGYGLGASVPRPFADNLCKMAVERGLVLILLEEAIDNTPSVWCFASDIVIELGLGAATNQDESRHVQLSVIKNRFGPMEPGPHRMEIGAGQGITVYPNVAAFLRPWSTKTLVPTWEPLPLNASGWGALATAWIGENTQQKLDMPYHFSNSVTLVFGPRPIDVAAVAARVGSFAKHAGRDVLLSFRLEPMLPGFTARELDFGLTVIPLGTRFHADRVTSHALISLAHVLGRQRVGRIFIGDLRRAKDAWGYHELRRALGVLTTFLSSMNVPVILMETGQAEIASPFFQLADVAVRGMLPPNTQVTLVHSGEWGYVPKDLARTDRAYELARLM